ncbi:MAG: menaquinone biosynthesis decarboxylase [Planctomycetes bacterium]|nr:menaquinone biosynthesis decarboxylase [Planctomycetota bacterium]
MYSNLSQFIAKLDSLGELKRIAAEVSPQLEITEIADRAVKAGGPALLFENVTGSSMPVLINAFGSERRMALALGVDDVSVIAERIAAFVRPQVPESLVAKLKMLALLAELRNFSVKKVRAAPCQEVVHDAAPSLAALPVLKCWPGDAGRFITLPLVFTRPMTGGPQNCGMYRMQVFDERTTGMHWHAHHDGARHFAGYRNAGKKMEVAVSLGGPPAATYAATAPMPPDVDEMLFAGFLRKKPVPMVQCKTVDLMVPAESEIVLEGTVAPDEERLEGPFGDHTGYYSVAGGYPVFRINCITHRSRPIYPATIVGKPPMEDCFMGKATERIFLPLIKAVVPEIEDIDLPLFGVFHNFAFVSISKAYPFQAQKAMHALWGLGQMMFTKIIVVVDSGVNVHDVEEVMWRVGNNIDPRRDVTFVRGPADILDHAAATEHFGTKMGIDATRKWPEEGFDRPWPDDIVMTDEVKRKVDGLWKDLGIGPALGD